METFFILQTFSILTILSIETSSVEVLCLVRPLYRSYSRMYASPVSRERSVDDICTRELFVNFVLSPVHIPIVTKEDQVRERSSLIGRGLLLLLFATAPAWGYWVVRVCGQECGRVVLLELYEQMDWSKSRGAIATL